MYITRGLRVTLVTLLRLVLNYIKSEFFIPAHVLKGNGADERGRPEQQQQQYQLAEQHISANVDLNAS